MQFDWTTLALQTVNLLVLVWLLRRFLFRPVMAIIAQRKEAAERILSDADSLRERARAEADRVAEREHALASEADQIVADAHARADAERTALLQQAKTDAAGFRTAAEAELDQQRQQIRRDLDAGARQLAVVIASRLLERVPAEALSTAMLQPLDTWLSTLGKTELATIADTTVDVVTATRLNPAIQASCTDTLHRHLGAVSLRFDTDRSLIAGIELRGPHATLRNHWRADLDRIAEELSHDDRHLAVA